MELVSPFVLIYTYSILLFPTDLRHALFSEHSKSVRGLGGPLPRTLCEPGRTRASTYAIQIQITRHCSTRCYHV